jgi:hypothetical protein
MTMMGDDKSQIIDSNPSVTVEWSEGRLLVESGGTRPPVRVLCGHSLFDGSSGWDSEFSPDSIFFISRYKNPDRLRPAARPNLTRFHNLRVFQDPETILWCQRLADGRPLARPADMGRCVDHPNPMAANLTN